jgi:hypothetical protein
VNAQVRPIARWNCASVGADEVTPFVDQRTVAVPSFRHARHDRSVTQGEVVLKLADLRRVCSLLLDEVERRYGDQIDMADGPADYYWNMNLAAAFGMTQTPEDHIDCGQSTDDVAEVSELARGSRAMIVLWHDLEHLAGVMRLLAFLDRPGQ